MTKNDLPAGFVSRMKAMLGEESESFFSSYENERGQALRLNPLKTDSFREQQGAEELLSAAGFLGESPERVPWAQGGYYYTGRPGRHPLHEAGMYYMQEPSAMAVAALAERAAGTIYPEGLKGLHVLDLCAAPGGKSTQLAGMMKGKGILVSNEIMPDRAKILSQNMERMGVTNSVVTNEPPEKMAARFPYFFDLIVVDAPCSGEGMFRKEEQALTMWSPENVASCAERQKGILREADTMLRSGGLLVYSTCTFAPEENERNIYLFLKEHPAYEVIDMREILGEDFDSFGFSSGVPAWCRSDDQDSNEDVNHEDMNHENMVEAFAQSLLGAVRLWPHKLKGEGHFTAILRKNAAAAGLLVGSGAAGKKEKTGTKKSGGKGKKSSSGPMALWQEFEKDVLNQEWIEACGENAGGEPATSGEELYLTPSAIPGTGLKVLRPGLHLGSFRKQRFEPSHALAMALTMENVKHIINIRSDSPEAYAYIRGESIPCDPSLKGWTVVFLDGCSAGWGKAAGGVLKNHYPKGLRRNYSPEN